MINAIRRCLTFSPPSCPHDFHSYLLNKNIDIEIIENIKNIEIIEKFENIKKIENIQIKKLENYQFKKHVVCDFDPDLLLYSQCDFSSECKESSTLNDYFINEPILYSIDKNKDNLE